MAVNINPPNAPKPHETGGVVPKLTPDQMPKMSPVQVPKSVQAVGTQHMLGEQYIASVLKEGKLASLMEHNVTPELFNGFEVQLFEQLLKHAKAHGKVPAQEVFFQHVEIDTLPDTTEPPSYYAQKLRDRFIADQIRDCLLEAKTLVTDKHDPMAALQMVQNRVMAMSMGASPRAILDMRESGDILLSAYAQQLSTPEDAAVMTGWETPDSFTGGCRGGDVISFVGRPADGKSWMTLYQALHAWRNQKKRVMFVSMEMLPLICAQRVSSMYTSTAFKYLMKAELPSPSLKKFKDGVVEMANEHAPFFVVDGNLTATVEDIWHYALMLKPDAIYIDGAYLVGNSNKRLDRFSRVAENARLFKSELSTNLKIPLNLTYQFNRDAAKKMKQKKGDNKAGLEDIGFSDEIGQLSSLVLAVQKNADVSSLYHRWVDILKGRNGETGGFEVNWDFRRMNFSEYIPDPTNLTMGAI
ncbi:DnaB-like helicase C-terminal domain-containing protein (plasmid) [Halobacteriovorax sp. GFR7]|uniref:DnaB-like helicase C-terminal domain-containing protein n=1 Tax=unclassified Halobacteriovorax TaxID=2639665 RepID=UPI003D997ABC